MMIEVRNGDIEAALRKLKKECSGLLGEVRRREYHLSRTQRRRVKDIAAARRRRKYEQHYV
jgi:ribosomal protein S21